MKSVIRFTATQKPEGDEYKKITYWNRFIRVKTETLIIILLVLVALSLGIYRLATGTLSLIHI